MLRVHDIKKWLYGSAAAGILGLTLLMAGYKDLLVSGWQYSYVSQGVVHPDEPTDVFAMYDSWLASKLRAGEIDDAELLKRKSELMSRMKVDWVTVREHRGEVFIDAVPGGQRFYHLMNTSYQQTALNRALMLLGTLLAFASLFGFIVEWRLRQVRTG